MKQDDVIGRRFVVEALAGRGGMSEVFRARDIQTKRTVALKVFREKGREDPRTTRFVREAELLERLRHPGIVQYVAHGVDDDGSLYLAMEWLEGEDLGQVIARSSLSIADCLQLARSVAGALANAHGAGVVHRDIKPTNIFLVGKSLSSIKVLDFGIAAVGGGVSLTRANEPIGTPAYMSPEQAKGLKVDAAADVFSLGCVLFECLAGKPPFWAEHPLAVMAKIVIDEAPKVRSLRTDTPEPFADVIDKMLLKDPKARLQTGKLVMAALAGVEVPSSRPSSPPPPPMSVPSSRMALGARERQLLSLMLVGAVDVAAGQATDSVSQSNAPTLPVVGDGDPNEAIYRDVMKHGGWAERLVDGTVVITLPGQLGGSSQADSAARCAMAVRRTLPLHPMVLVTGRTDGSVGFPMGEVVERGVSMLSEELRRAEAGAPASGVRIDDVTAGLLDRHFAITHEGDTFRLAGEGGAREAARTLLGQRSPFVGRDATIAELLEIYDGVTSSRRAAAVLVTAPPGFGKSRLHQEFLEWLDGRQAPPTSLVGRGDFTRRSTTLGVVGAALADFFGLRENDSDDSARRRVTSRLARTITSADQSRIGPFLGELVGVHFPESQNTLYKEALQDRTRLFDQIRNAYHDLLAAELALGPVIWVLDDLHESDDASISFIEAMLHAFATSPLMVLALARPAVDTRFPDLWAESTPTRVELGPLAPDAAAKLVRAAIGEPSREQLVETIVARAQGNAFFLEELVRAVAQGRQESLPQTLIAVVDAVLDALPPMCRRILRIASVFGVKFTVTGLRAVLPDASDRDVQAALDDLVDHEVLGRAPGSAANPFRAKLSFRSEIVRVACYEALTDEDRKQGHRLAGEWLESIGTPSDSSEVARHYTLAGDRQRAAMWHMRACEVAIEQAAFEEAVACAERAVSSGAGGLMLARSRLLQAEAMRHLGDSGGMLARSKDAMALIRGRTPGWWTAAANALTGAADLGRLDEASSLAKEIGAGPIAANADAARATIALFHLGRYDEANRMLDAISTGLRGGWINRALACRAMYAGDLRSYAARCQESVDFFEQTGDSRESAAELVSLGFVRQELGLYPEAEDALRLALSTAERLQLRRVIATGSARLGSVLMRMGRSDEAERYLLSSIGLFQKQNNQRMEGLARRQLGLLHIDRGALDPAFEQIMHASQLLSSYPPLLPMALAACARVMLATGKGDEALFMATDAIAALTRVKTVDEGEAFTYLVHAEALRATGRNDAADSAIRSARDRLLTRATQLDASMRPHFVDDVRENSRTIELALEWLRKVPAARPLPARVDPKLVQRRPARMRLAAKPSEAAEPPKPPPRKLTPPPVPSVRIAAAVLSSDPDRRALVARILGSHGADVQSAGSPGELFYLLDSAEESDHLVVFLDPLTPGLDGPAFVELLRQKESVGDARIVLAGGLSVKMMREATESWGADGFVALSDGPVDPEIALKRWLEVEEEQEQE